ncbi:10 kDa chaperonin [bacterium AB1]|nr:10 kDa chaperonin [bacterium AB1]
MNKKKFILQHNSEDQNNLTVYLCSNIKLILEHPELQVIPHKNQILLLRLNLDNCQNKVNSIIVVSNPESTEEKHVISVVLSVGENCINKKGDFIITKKWVGCDFVHNKNKYCLITQDDVLATIKNNVKNEE